ncbi:MAG: pilus assembly protein [Candidatus Solibacter usitatus]|nr:pilus assembly protein [Candidatus Solibacter usitatus]
MKRRGSSLLETALYLPILMVMVLGTIELARVTYTYYSIQKVLYTIARYVGTQQGVNFCDDTDTTVQIAKTYALTGTTDGSTDPFILGLTVDQIQVRIERYTAATGDIGVCDCSAAGCDVANGGSAPDYIVVSIPDGYPVTLTIPKLPLDPILLKPRVRVPHQGT